ncbi:von Willebrand factor A domain-containing protein 1 isoform X1 [Alligator mississippiensis]|uniref:von Willebrand factor A domain-containing protein 1 isoform X1 n=1 Tax=Alligator mississippiensis TaxID=8496 RepID=UPI0009072F0B|nr:von Willebrand factor A domain-containing protein 1 isoform X1 [Alligator mississippiensis]
MDFSAVTLSKRSGKEEVAGGYYNCVSPQPSGVSRTAGTGPQPFIPDLEGDILFLLDSSGSVSYYEFSKVKEFIRDLLRPFTFGPHDVQTSIIHISTVPTIEFPFDRYLSSEAVQQAIRGTQQLMGDTNTGKALSFAKEKFFTDEAGSRPDVPKVLVWVTDGFSTDDISPPMQLLKDMGVTVFIVSTGRGNFLELSAAASQPPEKHLHFVDVDDLPIITKELRDAITEVIRATRLRAVDITSSSFRLMWPKLLSSSTGYYVLEYTPTDEPRRKLMQQVSGDRTSLLLSDLAPETTYEVVLIPESNTHYIPPQTTRVTTLQEEISPTRIVISESMPHSIRVSWSPTPDSVVSYQVLYGPLPGNSAKLLEVDGKHNSTVLENLTPNTTYLVTVAAIYKSGKERALSAKACTQEEGFKVKHLRFEDMGPNTLKASWDSADGKVLGYRVRCRRQTGPSSLISVSPQVHSVLLTDLAAGTTNKVCVKPVYKDQAGKGLCRMVHMQPATEAQGYTRRQRA